MYQIGLPGLVVDSSSIKLQIMPGKTQFVMLIIQIFYENEVVDNGKYF